MPDRDDDFDTEIDKRPLKISSDADSEPVSKLRTAIDHDLAKRLMQAFPERFAQADSTASSNDEPVSLPPARQTAKKHLPRTVLQARLPLPVSETPSDQDVFDAPADPIEIPLARVGKILRRLRGLVASIPSSVRTLLAALLFAGAVGVGWWIHFNPVPVTQAVPGMPPPAKMPVSSVQAPVGSVGNDSGDGKSTVPSAPGTQATTDAPSVAETEAARAFIKGQRIEALNLYQRLSRQFPERKVYGVTIEVLQRSLQQTCSNGVTLKGEPCTEN